MLRNPFRGVSVVSWVFIWSLWTILFLGITYALRGPLKLTDLALSGSSYFKNLDGSFYLGVTGGSTIMSGIILAFEWYFRCLTDFIDGDYDDEDDDGTDEDEQARPLSEEESAKCKVWRNALALFRGAEYFRYKKKYGVDPLSYFDMNLTAQDHQSFFTVDDEGDREDLKIMQQAWRERDSSVRIACAKEALEKNEECAVAMLLLAEEESETIVEAEIVLRKALRSAEASYKKLQMVNQYHDGVSDPYYRREMNVLIYIRRRLAMCARKQGKLREAIKMMKDVVKEHQMANMFGVQENLIEAHLEMQSYADVQALLVRYDGYDIREPKSATLIYTSALLKARAVADKFAVEYSTKRGLSCAEMNAVEALMRAFEYNPHVPQYLLEMKELILPPEHYLRRGDAEALCYAFTHLQHWKRIDGALHILQCTWKGAFPSVARSINMSTYFQFSDGVEAGDKEILPSWHKVATFPKKESGWWSMLQGVFCVALCVTAVLIHSYPQGSSDFANTALHYARVMYTFFVDGFYAWIPQNFIGLLASRPSATQTGAGGASPQPHTVDNL